MRLIDGDALMETIRAHDYPLRAHFNSTDNGMFTLGIQQAVDEQPTVDAVPVVRGKWISDGAGYHWTYNCSVCGWKDGYPFNERHNYCPNCGADMREVVEIDQVKEGAE